MSALAQAPPLAVVFVTEPPPVPWLWYVFASMFGACVGSFLNVIIYRLPEGKSIVHPPSACPRCGHRLAWYDNVPVLGWLWLRGRCRYCQAPVSVQYPVIEAVTAAFFALTLYFYHASGYRMDFLNLGLGATWIVLLTHLLLIAGLIAASKIDAHLFIIPLEIPWVVTAIALLAAPLAAGWDDLALLVLPRVTAWQALGAAGGVIGLAGAIILLHKGVLRRSFEDEPAPKAPPDKPGGLTKEQKPSPPAPARPRLWPKLVWVGVLAGVCVAGGLWGGLGWVAAVAVLWWGGLLPDLGAYGPSIYEAENPDDWLAYPHPRREALREALFLLFPAGGVALGGLMGAIPGWAERFAGLPAPVQAFSGALFGYLAVAGIYWAVRIFFTLLFGKEALGLGDIHLMGAVGAVVGWVDAVIVLFLAAFFGLAVAVIQMIAGRLTKRMGQPIPFGPHLAGGTVILMYFRDPIMHYLEPLLSLLWQVGMIPS